MKSSDIILNDSHQLTDTSQVPEVHPVLIVSLGSTMMSLPLVLKTQLDGIANQVPSHFIGIDSLPYDDLMTRLKGERYPESQIHQALPRAHYFQLESPFHERFDFDNPLNRDWKSIIHEPSLRQIASKSSSQGCGGTPALGRAWAEGNESELRYFLERQIQQLTHVKPETLALRSGIVVFVITTTRGGTGTGALVPIAAILKEILADDGEIHAHIVMPCVFEGSDDRAHANSYALLRELQYFHRFGGAVPMKDGSHLPAPFGSVTCTFKSNGSVSIASTDAVMLISGLLCPYLRGHTQSTINTRLVDLTDVEKPYDLDDRPMHVAVQTAVSIRTIQPGVIDYMAVDWLRQEITAEQEQFEAWCRSKRLTPEAEKWVNAKVEGIIDNDSLSLDGLLPRLDGTPSVSSQLRNFFEDVTGKIATMKAKPIKESIVGLLQQIQALFGRFEVTWEQNSLQLAESLTRALADSFTSQVKFNPHLSLAMLVKLRQHVCALANQARQLVEEEKKKRNRIGQEIGPALGAVQEAGGGIFRFIKQNEVVRDAALRACDTMTRAAIHRSNQQRFEYLEKALDGELDSLDADGKPVNISSVARGLQDLEIRLLAEIRQRYSRQLNLLNEQLDVVGQRIERRSPAFQQALVYDRETRDTLTDRVKQIRENHPTVPAIEAFLKEQVDLNKTLEALRPLLPAYAESDKNLTDIIESDPSKRQMVINALRILKPFTPLDPEIETQQDLKNRRDTVVIFELPAGKEGKIAQILKQGAILDNVNQVVDSGNDYEIRAYFLRKGIPYGAIRPLKGYKWRYEKHLQKPGAITPHTITGADRFPGLEPSTTNLKRFIEEMLYIAKAVLPHRVKIQPAGGFTVLFDKEESAGFITQQEEEFPDFDTMARWLAKQVDVRKPLETELKDQLNADKDTYVSSLVTAWEAATGKERDYLQQALYQLRVDPRRGSK